MKTCSYCGQENDEDALHCKACATEFRPVEEVDPGLTDPADALMVVATVGDVVEASLLKDRLEQAGIEACIPEELNPSPFWNFKPLAHVTVRVAARNFEAAKGILAETD